MLILHVDCWLLYPGITVKQLYILHYITDFEEEMFTRDFWH